MDFGDVQNNRSLVSSSDDHIDDVADQLARRKDVGAGDHREKGDEHRGRGDDQRRVAGRNLLQTRRPQDLVDADTKDLEEQSRPPLPDKSGHYNPFPTFAPVEYEGEPSAAFSNRKNSASQPAIMAIMLEQLELKPGQRVLEIGAGVTCHATCFTPGVA